MQKGFWIIVVLVIAGMFGLFALTSDGSTNSSFKAYDPTVVQTTDHIEGISVNPALQAEVDQNTADKVVLIEYGDFQCPSCGAFFSVLQQLESDFKDDLAVVFRHFPLSQIHPDAMAAHRAAEAAARQGMFFEMHDLLYLRQQQWAGSGDVTNILESYAEELGLDTSQYQTDVAAAETFDRINVDIDSAAPLGVNATPTVFINGERVDEAPTYETLTKIINQALAA